MEKIIIKTDASHKPGEGAGIAYKATVYYPQGGYREIKNSKYVNDKQLNSTEAETIAAVWAMQEVSEQSEEGLNFNTVLESDCEYTVNSQERQYEEKDKIDKAFAHFSDFFSEFRTRWIPRSDNTKVDAMARQALDRGMRE